MRALFMVLVLVVVLLVQALPSLALSSNWFFSVQEDGFRCVDVILPDDSGYIGTGTHEYTITCEPYDECIYWGTTVTEERVAASENNTGIIPVCFIVPEGRPIGNCSVPMRIGVESLELGVSESWPGMMILIHPRDQKARVWRMCSVTTSISLILDLSS
jgi:hypothetical protein